MIKRKTPILGGGIILVNDCEGRRRIIEKEVVKDRQQWNRLTSTSSECVKYYADNPVFISCT